MKKETLIRRTLTALSKLPQDKANEIADFADYLLQKYEDEILKKGIKKLVSDSKAFEYLKSEENIYTVEDLKEKYK